MDSFSQAGQDRWVIETLKGKRDGSFLDLGCWHPTELNNTWLLERDYGWGGISMDRNPALAPKWSRAGRHFTWADASHIDWLKLGTHTFDYISIDCDEDQETVVGNLLECSGIRAYCLTVEHDSYRFGEKRRDDLRSLLTKYGYHLAVPDVALAGVAFEDWWIDPNHVTL